MFLVLLELLICFYGVLGLFCHSCLLVVVCSVLKQCFHSKHRVRMFKILFIFVIMLYCGGNLPLLLRVAVLILTNVADHFGTVAESWL